MVFEQFLTSDVIRKHPLFSFILGFFYVIISYFVAIYFFGTSQSIALMFATTLLLVPSTYVMIGIEEKRERKDGTKNFYTNHKDIIQIFLFLFLGIFFAYLFLGYIADTEIILGYQIDFLKARGAIVSQNLMVIVIAFLLSVFYGAGALFLITLNASVFASFILIVAQQINKGFSIIGLFLIHLIPEIGGFLIAAMAGGVVSRAIMKEEWGSKAFRNVMKDSIILLMISLGLIIIAAFLELFVTANLVKGIL